MSLLERCRNTERKQVMKTAEQIRVEGFKALVNALGYVDAIRFIQQFSNGAGDYSKERNGRLDEKSWDDLTKKKGSRRIGIASFMG